MRTLVLALLGILTASLMAQGPLPANWRESSELLPAAAVVVTSPHNVVVTRTGATTLSIGTGASATAPQTVRIKGPLNGQFKTRSLVSALTLTSTVGGGTGTIYVYGIATGANLEIVVINNLGGAMTCTGASTCTVSTSTGAAGRAALNSGVYLWSWSMTTGTPATFDTTGGASQPTVVPDAWVERFEIVNVAGSPVNVTVANGAGSWTTGTISVPANTVWSYKFGEPRQGQYFEGGMSVTAGAVSAIRMKTVWVSDVMVFNPAAPR